MIELINISKTYQVGPEDLTVLKGVDLFINEGDFISIMGSSGSGKTTLLNIIGCLDVPTNGSYSFQGKALHAMNEPQLASVRCKNIGFVFQMFNLIPRLSALRNVELPMIYAKLPYKQRKEQALLALNRVGLSNRVNHTPSQLSGGQQQRVAIARSIVNNPSILIADEPTGSLDSETSLEIMGLFKSLNEDGMSIIMVTHEDDISKYAERKVRLDSGKLIADSNVL